MGSVTEPRNAFALENLEDRRLMSAGLAPRVWDDVPAPVVSVSMHRSPSAMKDPRGAIKGYTQIVGTWSGTCKIAGSNTPITISMNITSQKNGSATGKFSLGPISGKTTVISVAQLSNASDHGFRVVLPGKNFSGGMTGAVSANGKQIVGRWACNGTGGWQTGTFVLNLTPAKR